MRMTNLEQNATDSGRYVRANGLDIYYEEQGEGEPLILIHGGTQTGSAWKPYLAAFAERYRVIMPDSRGHGRTSNPSGKMSFRLLADDMAGLVQALDLERPLIFGYSDGGQAALEIGMRYPDLPRALVIGGAYPELTEGSRRWVESILGDEQSPEVDIEKFERENPEFAAGLKEDHGPEAWKALLKNIKPMWNATLNYTDKDWARVTAPTLVVDGDRDGFVSVEDGVEMYRRLPNAEFMVVPGANHIHFMFSPTKIAAMQPLILDFLSRHSASAKQNTASDAA
jgi:pimeloyl-ACP methyl ester carboxylesterase